MPSSTIRRQMKNVVNNYTDAEKKVREATSNDPWGPSSSLMSEIADLTYNVVAFSEIMTMIWRRLNDHGKNWRHVYKALTLLDYLVKTGSERVALQCRENIFAIQTLKDFQYVDRDGKDQGINVREKSKQLVTLLKDDERLKGERSQALKTKERMAQVATSVGSGPSGFGRGSSQPNLSTSHSEEYGRSEGSPASYHGSTSPNASSELEQARPQTSGEEELQLQLALAMSREAAEQEERMRRGDDLRLQMALEESRKDSTTTKVVKKEPPKSSLMDLMDIVPAASAPAPVSDPWAGPSAKAAVDPWQPYATASKPAIPVDPWVSSSSPTPATPPRSIDPWVAPVAPAATASDPWAPVPASRPKAPASGTFDPFHTLNGTSKEDLSEFDSLRSSSSMTGESRSPTHAPRPMASVSPDLFDPLPATTAASRKTPESFLGPNAALVNLDSLISKPPQLASVSNPFLAAGSAPPPPVQVNPFQVNQPQPPTLNQMRVNPMMGPGAQGFGGLPQMTSDPLSLSSMPPGGPMAMVPMTGMAAIAPVGSVQPSMAVPQPLLTTGLLPSGGAQAGTTTNPFLL
uniref:Epsin 2 n=1 Tax=Paramormyrops kingsleyae TaxID=1676925 RepID=A0A3B3TDA3_9TELE|nr:epsin-2 isoform X1 [Paramormyrops kingsleyae]XP_023677617.1 epsin-2 isoform X1 [Paramormyrops kingsleyae]